MLITFASPSHAVLQSSCFPSFLECSIKPSVINFNYTFRVISRWFVSSWASHSYNSALVGALNVTAMTLHDLPWPCDVMTIAAIEDHCRDLREICWPVITPVMTSWFIVMMECRSSGIMLWSWGQVKKFRDADLLQTTISWREIVYIVYVNSLMWTYDYRMKIWRRYKHTHEWSMRHYMTCCRGGIRHLIHTRLGSHVQQTNNHRTNNKICLLYMGRILLLLHAEGKILQCFLSDRTFCVCYF